MKTNGASSPAEQAVCLLRDLAERLAKDKGISSEGMRRQLRAINHAARRILIAGRTATPMVALHDHRSQTPSDGPRDRRYGGERNL